MADKIQKSIEFKASKAVTEIDKLIKRLQKTSDMLKKVEATANSISFQKFIPAIETFSKSFSKLKSVPENIQNIQLMAQALNRFRMVAVELNKKDMTVSFEKITRAIYRFTESIGRMKILEDTILKISELGRAINRLVNSSVKMQNMKVSFTSLTQAIYKFVGSILRIKDLEDAITKIERLATAMDLLARNSKKFTVVRDFAQFEKSKKKIASLQETIKKLKEEIAGLKQSEKTVSKVGTAFEKISGSFNSLTRALRFSNLTHIYYMFKRIGNIVYDLVKKYAEYQENINLATVAYGKLNGQLRATTELYPFVEKMAGAFGLNESELIRSVGLFKQMANAMRLTQEQGDLLSEGLTKMAYDISSLYNVSFDRAMSALQSSLVGQTKPIRGATGADITENTLRITLQELGIGKEIRDLSYVEKRLIMVISLTNQLANAQGDLARTIESPANQLKILEQQLQRVGIQIGRILDIGMHQVIPIINGALMALVVLLETVATWLETITGYKYEQSDEGIGGITDEVGELIDGMEEANDQVEDLKKNLIGIDELNILEPNTKASIFGEIDPTILGAFEEALTNWDNRMEQVRMKAQDIRDLILSWLGLEPTEDGWGLKEGASLARTIKETLENMDLDKVIADFGKIASLIGTSLMLLIGWKIVTNPFFLLLAGISLILGENELTLERIGEIMLGTSLVVAGIGILFKKWNLLGIAAIFLGIYEIMEGLNGIFKDGVLNWQDMSKILKGVAVILGAFAILTHNWVVLALAGITLLAAFSLHQLEGFESRLFSGTTTFVDWLALAIAGIFHGIIFLAEKAIKLVINLFLTAADTIGKALFGVATVIAAVLDAVLVPLVSTVKSVVSIYDKIKGTNYASNIKFFQMTSDIAGVYGNFNTGIDMMKKAVKETSPADAFYNSALEAMKSKGAPNSSKANGTFSTESFQSLWESIKKSNEVEVSALEDVAGIAKDQLNATSTTNVIASDILDVVSSMSATERKEIISGNIRGFASGGYPNKGVFLMNEGNSAEMLGTINGRTAVANNDQIAGALSNALAPLLGTVVTAVENVAGSDRPIVLYADSREIARASQKGSKKLGYNPIGGEFANV